LNPELDPADKSNVKNRDTGYQTGKSGEVGAHNAKASKGPNPAMESSLPSVHSQDAPKNAKDKNNQGKKS
jgi:hypothetical protein